MSISVKSIQDIPHDAFGCILSHLSLPALVKTRIVSRQISQYFGPVYFYKVYEITASNKGYLQRHATCLQKKLLTKAISLGNLLALALLKKLGMTFMSISIQENIQSVKGSMKRQHPHYRKQIMNDSPESFPIIAAQHKQADQFPLLKEMGFDLNAPGKCERTPATIACLHGDFATFQQLYKCGVNLTKGDGFNQSPVKIALQKGHFKFISFMENKKIFIPRQDSLGDSLATIAINLPEDRAIAAIHFLSNEFGPDILDIPNKSGNTAAIIAAQNKKFPILEALSYHGCDLTKKNPKQVDPILILALNNDWKVLYKSYQGNICFHDPQRSEFSIIKTLTSQYISVLKHIANKNPQPNLRVEIDLAIVLDKGKDIDRLVKEHGTEVFYTSNGIGLTPTTFAAFLERGNILQILDDLDIDIEDADFNGYSPVEIAFCQKNHYFLNFLGSTLQVSFSPPENSSKRSILHIAAKNRDWDMVRLLSQYIDLNYCDDANDSLVEIAVDSQNYEMLSVLKKMGTDFTSYYYDAMNPMTSAASKGHANLVKHLVQLGCDVESRDLLYNTAAIEAAGKNQTLTLEVLHELQADFRATNQAGRSPSTEAAFFNSVDVFDFLQTKVSLYDCDENGHSPATVAAHFGRNYILEKLHALGIDLNQEDALMSPPIVVAAFYQESITVRNLILDWQVDPYQCDGDGFSAATIAAYHGYDNILITLQNCGVNLHKKDLRGNTPLSIAEKNHDKNIIDLLIRIS